MHIDKLLVLAWLAGPVFGLNATEITKRYFGNDSAWYNGRIALFKASAIEIQNVYYYRWNMFRAHQCDLGVPGYISTEFLEDVSWQTQPSAVLIDAANMHLREGRWCRDRRFKDDYGAFLFGPNENPYQFSESMADGVWQGSLFHTSEQRGSITTDMRLPYNETQLATAMAKKGLLFKLTAR